MRTAVALVLVGAWSVSACKPPPPTDPTCGARVSFGGADGSVVTLEFENVTLDSIEIGSSADAAFVDTSGMSMEAKMNPGSDDWFMGFALPSRSKRRVTVTLGTGGTPAKLDRVEIPYSGPGRIPRCTIKASGLARP